MSARGNRPVAFVYGGLLAGHACSETARDALYLARHEAADLPRVYFGLAIAGALTSVAMHRWRDRGSASTRPAMLLAIGAIVMFGFGAVALAVPSGWGTALYLWIGLFGMTSTSMLWAWIAGRSDLRSARHDFAQIGSAGIMGAIAGSLGAVGLARWVSTPWLLVASGVVLACTSAATFWIGRNDPPVSHEVITGVETPRLASAQRRYAGLLVALVVVAAVALTAADLLFKTTIATHVSTDHLAIAFGLTAASTDTLALVVQTLLTPWLLRRFGLATAMSALPLALVATSLTGLSGALVPAAYGLRAVAGSLQHSLYGTTTELLTMPFDVPLRRRIAATLQPVGYRFGQAVAALVSVVMARSVDASMGFTFVMVLATAWLGIGLLTHRHYLSIFRARLGAFEPDPALPLPSHALSASELETLLPALSLDETTCMAALRMLERHGRSDLVPSTLLAHPSSRVVERTVDLLARTARSEAVSWLARCLDHSDANVRARAAAAIVELRGTIDIAGLLDDPSAAVRMAARVLALRATPDAREEHLREIAALADCETRESREALVRAWGYAAPDPSLDALVARVVRRDARALAWALVDAVALRPERSMLEALATAIPVRASRAAVHAALRARSAAALSVLESMAGAPDLPRTLRLHLPDAVAALLTPEAGAMLHDWLRSETDGAVRYNVLRALGRFAHDGGVLPDVTATAVELAHRTVVRWVKLASWRERLAGWMERDAGDQDTIALLEALLLDKEKAAMERLFRLLGLFGLRGESSEMLYDGVRSGDATFRESALELLEHALIGRDRDAILVLLSDEPTRVTHASSALGIVLSRDPSTLMAELRADGSAMIRDVAAHVDAARRAHIASEQTR